jgi:hypothetical protein
MGTKSSNKTSTFLLELIDEQDPLFLYSISMDESDFHNLKEKQKLRFEFSRFPSQFKELLQNCAACAHEQSPR